MIAKRASAAVMIAKRASAAVMIAKRASAAVMMRGWAAWVLRGLGLTLLCLSLVAGRVVLDGRAHLRAGLAARDAGDQALAVRELGRGARMYAPGSPYSARAFALLFEMATQAEARGDTGPAIACYRELRHAALGARSFYTPHADLVAQADRRLADLVARSEAERRPPLASSRGQALRLLEQLQRDEAPHPGWSALAVGAAGLMIAAAVCLGRRRAWRWGMGWCVAYALGLGLFCLALLRA